MKLEKGEDNINLRKRCKSPQRNLKMRLSNYPMLQGVIKQIYESARLVSFGY